MAKETHLLLDLKPEKMNVKIKGSKIDVVELMAITLASSPDLLFMIKSACDVAEQHGDDIRQGINIVNNNN